MAHRSSLLRPKVRFEFERMVQHLVLFGSMSSLALNLGLILCVKSSLILNLRECEKKLVSRVLELHCQNPSALKRAWWCRWLPCWRRVGHLGFLVVDLSRLKQHFQNSSQHQKWDFHQWQLHRPVKWQGWSCDAPRLAGRFLEILDDLHDLHDLANVERGSGAATSACTATFQLLGFLWTALGRGFGQRVPNPKPQRVKLLAGSRYDQTKRKDAAKRRSLASLQRLASKAISKSKAGCWVP